GEQPQQPRRAVRLGRIADRHAPGIRRHRAAERAGTRADRRIVVDIQRRSVLRSERDEITPAHRERVARRETRRVGEQRGGEAHRSDAMALITSPISAARRRPTTPAFTPASADCAHGRARSAPHDGSAAKTTRNAGRKIPTSAIAAPATPLGGQTAKRSTIALGSLYEGNGAIAAPRYAANVKSGPGTAWAVPVTGDELLLRHPAGRHDLVLQQGQHDVTAAEDEGARAIEGIEQRDAAARNGDPRERKHQEQRQVERTAG